MFPVPSSRKSGVGRPAASVYALSILLTAVVRAEGGRGGGRCIEGCSAEWPRGGSAERDPAGGGLWRLHRKPHPRHVKRGPNDFPCYGPTRRPRRRARGENARA